MKHRIESRVWTYSNYLQQKFGERVYRVGLSTGVPCPHRVRAGGCIFCDPRTFTGAYQEEGLSVTEQLNRAVPWIKRACGVSRLLAYFQDETSTAGDIEFLHQKFSEALSYPDVIGLVLSTRPDYIDPKIIELLASFSVPVTIEIGMQSLHDQSLKYLRRGHNMQQTEEAIKLCGEAGLTVGVHLILGIPEETFSDMKKTIQYISENSYIQQVKFHNMVVYKNTELAKMIRPEQIYSLADHIENLGRLLPYLRGNIAVTRLFTTNVRKDQIALGDYPGNKPKWINRLRMFMTENDFVQGSETEVEYDYKIFCRKEIGGNRS